MNILVFKKSGDERLDFQKFKAGYYAFWTMFLLSVAMTFIVFNLMSVDDNPVILLFALPWFIAMFIYETIAWEYLQFTEEQKLKDKLGRKRFMRSMIIRLTLTLVFASVTNYYFVSDKKSIGGSIAYGCVFTAIMGIILYSEYRAKLNRTGEVESDEE